jgi:ribosomal protein L11 methyltransferase
VPPERAEEARAVLVELFPEGFEERDVPAGVELAAYTDEAGEQALRAECRRLGLPPPVGAPVQDGWEERWRDFHRGVGIGPLWVGPPWEAPPADAVSVVIDPGRAFGTGAHPTTRLCLALIAELPRGSLLDVGCGSGVLAVAAAKLGHAPVYAVDIEEDAVQATLRNAQVNRVEVDAVVADACRDESPEVDTVVANLTLAAIEAAMPRVHGRCLVTSGYLTVDEPRIRGFRRLRRAESDGWAADVWRCV